MTLDDQNDAILAQVEREMPTPKNFDDDEAQAEHQRKHEARYTELVNNPHLWDFEMDVDVAPVRVPVSPFDSLIQIARQDIAARAAQLDWLIAHRPKLEPIGIEGYQLMGYSLDINNPTREQVTKVIQALGGKWTKEPVSHDPTKLNYIATIDGVAVRLWCAPPPPTCRLVEREIEIPAQPARIEKRMVLDCTPMQVVGGEE